MKLSQLIQTRRTICVAGIDDAHYAIKSHGSRVQLACVVCGGTRFEGMLWGHVEKDGLDATEKIVSLVGESKFASQLHLVLLDGITFGGCNIVDLHAVSQQLELPTVAVMRRQPDLVAFKAIFEHLPDPDQRLSLTESAGEIYQVNDWVFQCQGEEPSIIAAALTRLTDRGKVPEALRLAHLIGSAVTLGESTNRA